MKFSKKKSEKKCPRCGERSYIAAKTCDCCGLVFDRLKYASNKKAKEAIRRGAREEVIKSATLPKDVNKWKLLFMCLFGGLFGLHNLVIGRYIKGGISLFVIVITFVLLAFFSNGVVTMVYSYFLAIPAGIVFYWWFYDLLMIGFDKYKVPIALDMPKKEVRGE